ncbi:hypothetical protein [Streptomyces sp. NPDC007856]|uniref:hypothetical protein n=1 Tax=Streptomyces sp. NPDC007856 TaxID=3364781 RepID=UPI0036BD5F8C
MIVDGSTLVRPGDRRCADGGQELLDTVECPLVRQRLRDAVLRKVVPPKGALAFIAMSFVVVILVVSDGSLSTLLSHPGDFGPDALLLFAALRWVPRPP